MEHLLSIFLQGYSLASSGQVRYADIVENQPVVISAQRAQVRNRCSTAVLLYYTAGLLG